MQIEVKKIKATKSVIMQMEYVGVRSLKTTDVILGWVKMDKLKWVIVKSGERFLRAEYLEKVTKVLKRTQFPSPDGPGWHFPEVHQISVETHNKGVSSFSANENDEVNLKNYEGLFQFMRAQNQAGQIFY